MVHYMVYYSLHSSHLSSLGACAKLSEDATRKLYGPHIQPVRDTTCEGTERFFQDVYPRVPDIDILCVAVARAALRRILSHDLCREALRD